MGSHLGSPHSHRCPGVRSCRFAQISWPIAQNIQISPWRCCRIRRGTRHQTRLPLPQIRHAVHRSDWVGPQERRATRLINGIAGASGSRSLRPDVNGRHLWSFRCSRRWRRAGTWRWPPGSMRPGRLGSGAIAECERVQMRLPGSCFTRGSLWEHLHTWREPCLAALRKCLSRSRTQKG
jgi:hypothetical protein